VHGHIGIGHTRWATHGGVTEPNAHPHISGGLIAVVHNGIIENFESERVRLQGLGYVFSSQTDTEVIAHAVKHEYEPTATIDLSPPYKRPVNAFTVLTPSA
jgi:glucosamine--fructose-6-phosphate aminotransferase (isomerizing)